MGLCVCAGEVGEEAGGCTLQSGEPRHQAGGTAGRLQESHRRRSDGKHLQQ